MSCNCGGPRNRPLLRANASQGKLGVYMLASYPDCTTVYSGPLSGEAAFVVATGSPDERLFRWVDYQDASAYATQLGLTQIDNVPVTSLCPQAVEDLYAS